jgi:hypothetical protein
MAAVRHWLLLIYLKTMSLTTQAKTLRVKFNLLLGVNYGMTDMPRTKRNTSPSLRLACDNPEDTFTVSYTNQGDPFREGIRIGIENQEFKKDVIAMLEDREAKELRDMLIKHYPLDT